jgi:aerobic-type carbon monoxide dehydrogenase small subunit (CoxS/CutS family)
MGCDHGQCRACTVMVDGRHINSCLTLAVMHEGAQVTTIEGVGGKDTLHPMQAAFIKHDGFQCGYCTPGQICSAIAVLDEIKQGIPSHVSPSLTVAPLLSAEEIREAARLRRAVARLVGGRLGPIAQKATTAGNLLRRTRCPYFYDTKQACNKRRSGSGCAAIGGYTRSHAVIGVSDACIATDPSDMAIAMRLLDARVETLRANGSSRVIPIADFHRLPGDTPHLAGYEVPVHADIPAQEVIFLDETDPLSSPMKAKGIGELGLCGVGAAIANAVYNHRRARLSDYARQAAGGPAAGVISHPASA